MNKKEGICGIIEFRLNEIPEDAKHQKPLSINEG